MHRHCNRKMIITTPSNSAANLYVEFFMKIPELAGEFKRLVSYNQCERNMIPDSMVQHCAMINISSDNNEMAAVS
jgi:hypothetical protein